MPSITTHHMFAKEVLNHLSFKEKSHFKNEALIYYTFAQSHDFLFYYTFGFKNVLKIRELGHHAHHHKTGEYLINIVKNIKEKKLENNPQAMAYLYGSITHYCLDTTTHPYIFYKTGIYRPENKDSIKYKGEHNHIEKDIDAIYYEKYTTNKCNISKEIIGKPKFSLTLTNLISSVFKETYNEEKIGIYYQKAIKHAKIISTLAINDKLGLKKSIYTLIDKITKKRFGLLNVYSTHILHPNISYLNLEHKTWNHPCDKNLLFHDSFEDLYEKSLKKCLNIIKAINKVLYENKNINTLTKLIPNLDYSTGFIEEKNKRMDYFE